MTRRIALIAMENCLASNVAGVLDMFSAANLIARHMHGAGSPLFDVTVASDRKAPLRASNGMQITPDRVFSRLDRTDAVMIAGLGTDLAPNLHESLTEMRPLGRWLRAQHEKGALIAASCTGTFFLAESGLLDGRGATTTWWLAGEFRQRYPHIRLQEDKLLVEEVSLMTAAAGMSYLDLALRLIERLEGAELARLTAKFMVIENNRLFQKAYAVPVHLGSRDPVVEKADAWITAHMAEKTEIGALARHLAVTPRTLHRRFSESLGQSPQQFIAGRKLERAKHLLETSAMSQQQVMAAIGYQDLTAFRRAFKTHTGLSPVQYRKEFQRLGNGA